MTAIAYETYYLGVRTTRRFIRVPANVISILFFPIFQLLVFSQLYEDIVQLPGFAGDVSYLAYLAPGQIVFDRLLRGGVGRLRAADGDPERLHRQAAGQPHPPLVDPAQRDGAAVLPGRGHVSCHPGPLRCAGHAHRDRYPRRAVHPGPGRPVRARHLAGRASSRPWSPRASRPRARSRCSCSRWSSPPPRSSRLI